MKGLWEHCVHESPTLVGFFFLLAGFSKVLDPSFLVQEIEDFGLVPDPTILARLVIGVEIGLGLALALRIRWKSLVFSGYAILLLFTAFPLRKAVASGIGADCSCMNLVLPTPVWIAIIRNGLLLWLLTRLILLKPKPARRGRKVDRHCLKSNLHLRTEGSEHSIDHV